MFIVVQHQISDPKKFWEEAQAAISNLPAEMKIHSTLPNSDGTKAVCLWEANDINSVKDAIESSVGNFSKNEYFSVETKKCNGLASINYSGIDKVFASREEAVIDFKCFFSLSGLNYLYQSFYEFIYLF